MCKPLTVHLRVIAVGPSWTELVCRQVASHHLTCAKLVADAACISLRQQNSSMKSRGNPLSCLLVAWKFISYNYSSLTELLENNWKPLEYQV